MYSENLDKLIELALADGILTEKERQVLIKKAEIEGIDIDEFEMVLDGMLFEKNKSVPHVLISQSSQDKPGDLKKCPSCGAPAQAFSIKCPDCGYEYRNVKSNLSIQNLFELLNQAENTRENSTTGIFSKLQNVFGVNDTDKRKLEIISSFPIPTTKDDMLEFLSLALPKTKVKKTLGFMEADQDKVPNMYARTWLQKCEQIIMKAKFTMKDDKQTLQEIEHYARQLNLK